jgi:hypothetical protein
MPVKLSNIGRQKSVAAIARAVFGGLGKADLEQAEEALRRANPCLGKEDGLTPGAPIIVPELLGLEGAAPREGFSLPDEALRLVAAAAGAFTSQAGAPLDAILKDSADQAKLLKKADIVEAVAARRPDLRARLPQLAAEAEEEVKKAKEAAVKLRAAIAQIEKLLLPLPPPT